MATKESPNSIAYILDWEPNKFYKKYTVFVYDGVIYRVPQNMTTPLIFSASDYEELNPCP